MGGKLPEFGMVVTQTDGALIKLQGRISCVKVCVCGIVCYLALLLQVVQRAL